MNLILIGAPGAGKGTLAEQLVESLGTPAISTGNLLREAIRNQTELGTKAKSFMDAGALVPDALVIDMLRDRIGQPDCQNGYILDGFPRTIPQAEALDTIADITCALYLEIADDVIEARMSGRRVCPQCGASYHTVNNPTKVPYTCDKCQGKTTIREDDTVEVVRKRLVTYHAQTEPLIAYYTEQGKCVPMSAVGEIDEIHQNALAALGK